MKMADESDMAAKTFFKNDDSSKKCIASRQNTK
jgi:hypothetical protein